MSRSLCLLEVLVHTPLDFAPLDYVVVQLSLPETARVAQLSPSKLPRDWNVFPYSESTQLVGDAFLREAKYLTMKVPSAIVPEEWNVLINPVHPLAASITILRVDPLILDPRFLRS